MSSATKGAIRVTQGVVEAITTQECCGPAFWYSGPAARRRSAIPFAKTGTAGRVVRPSPICICNQTANHGYPSSGARARQAHTTFHRSLPAAVHAQWQRPSITSVIIRVLAAFGNDQAH